ncbi:hypothetical protein L1987_51718 [Smallanthus sonchifolius]|uniref:Uncharacterized protein n=1 Tax=Smallanthus sonchifolius TaxID=185202 RepID=A0ACB9ES84_9ASTR|nr:hypothetical protein L1987_51718 [Smallanthus sonchifolius]
MVKRTIWNVKKASLLDPPLFLHSIIGVAYASVHGRRATTAKAASSDKTAARIAMHVSGADPSEIGKGGEFILGRPFKDDTNSKLLHYGRGAVSMAKISRRYNFDKLLIY